MISIWMLLDPHAPQKVCVQAYRLYLKGMEAPQVVEHLKKEGFTERIAARAVTFLPSAFARVHYEKEGLTFPDYFYPGREAYSRGKFRRYADEPVFLAARRLAEQLERDGELSRVWRFIEISAEHRGIASARAHGETPIGTSLTIHEF